MSTPANSINEPTTGIVGMTGTGFTASPTTPFLVQIGGTNSYELDEVAIGTAGQVLTSNGAGAAPTFQAAGGGGLQTISGQLTSAQIKAIHGTPIQILPAQGANTIVVLLSYATSFVYGGSNVFVAGSAQTIQIYAGTTGPYTSAFISNAMIISSASLVSSVTTGGFFDAARATYVNQVINWYNPVVTEISGNAANNNVINWSITYRVVTV